VENQKRKEELQEQSVLDSIQLPEFLFPKPNEEEKGIKLQSVSSD